MKADRDSIASLLERMRSMRLRTHQRHNATIIEAMDRIVVATHLAALLEDSLFYARSYQDKDQTGSGKLRRQEMIDEAEYYIKMFRIDANEL